MPKVERPRGSFLLALALALIVFGIICVVMTFIVIRTWTLGGPD